jgi:tetratricopeptide (TPR) repeat protein
LKSTQTLHQGLEHHQAGRLAEAADCYARVLAADPQHADALNLLGLCSYQRDDATTAVELIGRSIALRGDFPPAHANLGHARLALGDAAAALDAYAAARYGYGIALERLDRRSEAVASYRAVLAAEPGHPQAALNLAALLDTPAQAGEALALCQQVLAKHPDYRPARIGEARALGLAGDRRQARELLDRLLVEQPEDVDALRARARLAVADEDHAAATRDLERALAAEPDNPDLRNDLGIAHQGDSRLDEAIRQYRAALVVRPGFPEALNNLGLALRAAGETEAAREAFEAAIARRAEYPEAHANLGNVLRDLGDADAAVRCFEKAIALRSGFVDAWIFRGAAELERGQADAAIDALDTALGLAPANRQAIAYRAAALWETGRDAEALSLLDFRRLVRRWRLDAADLAEFNAQLVEYVTTHPSLVYERAANATRHGRHTGNLLADSQGPVPRLREFLQQRVQDYLAELPANPAHPFLCHGLPQWWMVGWAVVMERQGHQLPHTHPSGWVSGCYYPKLPTVVRAEDDGHAGWIEFGRPPASLKLRREPPVQLLQPEEGTIVLFPSYLYHRTIPFDSDQTRVSIAFDVLPGRGPA